MFLLKEQVNAAVKYRNSRDQKPAETKRLDSLGQTAAIKLLDLAKSGSLNDKQYDERLKRHHSFIIRMLDMDEQEFERELQREELIGTFTSARARVVRMKYREAKDAIQNAGRHQESPTSAGGTGEGTTTGDDAESFDFLDDGPEA